MAGNLLRDTCRTAPDRRSACGVHAEERHIRRGGEARRACEARCGCQRCSLCACLLPRMSVLRLCLIAQWPPLFIRDCKFDQCGSLIWQAEAKAPCHDATSALKAEMNFFTCPVALGEREGGCPGTNWAPEAFSALEDNKLVHDSACAAYHQVLIASISRLQSKQLQIPWADKQARKTRLNLGHVHVCEAVYPRAQASHGPLSQRSVRPFV